MPCRLCRDTRTLRRFQEVNEHDRGANHGRVVLNGVYFPFVDFLGDRDDYCARLRRLPVFDDAITDRTLRFILYLSNFFSTPCSSCRSLTTRSWPPTAALDKIMDAMDEEPEAWTARTAAHGRDVRFDDVRFAYGRGARCCTD